MDNTIARKEKKDTPWIVAGVLIILGMIIFIVGAYVDNGFVLLFSAASALISLMITAYKVKRKNINIDELKKTQKILWKIIIVTGILSVLFITLGNLLDKELITALGTYLIFITIVAILINIKSYDFIPFFLVFYLLSILFKNMHWPGGSFIMILAIGLISIISIVMAINIAKSKNTLSFLKWFSFFAYIILSLLNFTFLFKMQHWPGGSFLQGISVPSFIILILALVFTLPNSRYMEWTQLEKKFFFRGIMTQMVFLFLLTSLSFVSPDTFMAILGKTKDDIVILHMEKVELIPHEGIVQY